VPHPGDHRNESVEPALSVLISSREDLHLGPATGADLHFQLPNSLAGTDSEYVDLLTSHRELTPWFPSILVGEDFEAAVNLLHRTQPKRIVTDNTGVAAEAFKAGIPWIAGPSLNTANSLALLSLKERFDCPGAFVSNELSKHQMARLRRPADFELFYRIYYPIVLMTSRACLHHQAVGCSRERVDQTCITSCEKTSSVTNSNGVTFSIKKTRGHYSRVVHQHHCLNTSIVTDLPALFSGFLVDLTNIDTETRVEVDKPELIRLFEQHLKAHPGSARELKQVVHPTTLAQYRKGV